MENPKEVPNSAPLTPEELNKVMANQVLPSEPSKEERTKLKAKRAVMLDRGLVNSNLAVDNLPDHLHGEWGPNDPNYIRDMTEKGFIIDNEYTADKMRTSAGKIPDVIYFVTPRWNKELQDEVVGEAADKKHGKKGDGKLQAEEKEAIANAAGDLPIISESGEDILDSGQLEGVLNSHIAEKLAAREASETGA